MTEYHTAVYTCLLRYKALAEEELKRVPLYILYGDLETLSSFIDEAMIGCVKELPINKLNRWLGYIQGVLIASRITDVETERNWTRPIFKPLDFPLL